MNKLKSIFISLYLTLATILSSYAVIQLLNNGIDELLIGMLLINIPILLFISRIMIFKNMARTSVHFPFSSLSVLIGTSLVTYSHLQQNINNDKTTLLILSVSSSIMYYLYLYWYSLLNRSTTKTTLKYKLPTFYLTDINNSKVSSDSYVGFPTIFIFIRGNWCPLCMAQVKEIAKYYQKLSQLGANVVIISRQKEKQTKALADRFNVPLNFMTDEYGDAARILEIEMKNGLPLGMEVLGYDKDTTLPTVIITNSIGEIIYSDFTENYRIRPEPTSFINIIKSNSTSV